MIVHQIFAQISEGTVQNIMVCADYELANYLTRCTYGDEAFAVDCLQYPCSIGDNYHDGKFWSVADDGTETEIEYVPTQEQQVANLQYSNDELTVAMADVLGGAV